MERTRLRLIEGHGNSYDKGHTKGFTIRITVTVLMKARLRLVEGHGNSYDKGHTKGFTIRITVTVLMRTVVTFLQRTRPRTRLTVRTMVPVVIKAGQRLIEGQCNSYEKSQTKGSL